MTRRTTDRLCLFFLALNGFMAGLNAHAGSHLVMGVNLTVALFLGYTLARCGMEGSR